MTIENESLCEADNQLLTEIELISKFELNYNLSSCIHYLVSLNRSINNIAVLKMALTCLKREIEIEEKEKRK